MKWPWQKKEEEQSTDWSKQYNWYTPKSAESTDWSKQYDWYTPKAEPEPPKPSTMDNIKSTAGQVKDTVTSPTFWEKVSDLNDKIEDTVKKPAKWLGKAALGPAKESNKSNEPFKLWPSKEDWGKAADALKNYDIKEVIDTGRTPLGQAIVDNPGPAGWVVRNTEAGIADVSNAFYRIPQSLGGDKIPGLNKALDYGVQSTKHFQNKGDTDPASQVYRSTVGMAPNIALAYLSKGASLPYQMPAYGGEAVRQATMQMLKSPAFQLSFLRSYGSGAGEAMDAGSNRVDAISAGLQQAIPQAMIEVGGGVEKLPEKAGQSLLKTIGKTALEEGLEEIAQYPFEGLAKKATYAPETPVFSVNEQAVINPVQQAQAGLVGGLAGGLLGGAGGMFNNAFNAQANVNSQPETQYRPPSNNVFYADQYGNVTQDPNFRPFLQLPPGPDFQARPETNFYVDQYGNVTTDPNYRPFLQLPAGPEVVQQPAPRPQADFYSDQYGITSNDPNHLPVLQLPAPAEQVSGTDAYPIANESDTPGIDTQIKNALKTEPTPQQSDRYFPNQITPGELEVLNQQGINPNIQKLSETLNQQPVSNEPDYSQGVGERFSPNRLTPANLEALNKRGINPNVTRQSDSLSMLNPPIAQPDYRSAVGQVDTPFRLFPGEIDPLSNMEHPIGTPVQTSQETITGALESTQPNILGDTKTPATVKPDAPAGEQMFNDVPGSPGYKQRYKQRLRGEMLSLLEDSDSAKDKAGWQLAREIPQRNAIDVFGEKAGKKINEKVFRPIKNSEAQRIKFINEHVEKVKKLKLSKKESKYVQMLGEGKITEDQLPRGMDKTKIKNAVNEFRQIYDNLLKVANEVLVRNGYDPVDYRKDYFPHFDDPSDPFLSFMKSMGFKVDNITLPTDIAGITHQFRPGKKWFGHFLERTTDQTAFDALEGFERYLHGISDVIYHTDNIQRLRAFETAIRSKYAPDNIKNRIAEIEDSDLSPEEQQAAIDALFQVDRGHLGNYVTNLREFTDILAGKKSISDRNMEHKLGRATYNIFDNANTQVAKNMVGWNVGSWLTNFIPIPQAGGGINTKNLLKAARDTVFSYISDDGFRDKSTFLTSRKGVDRLNQTAIEKISEAGLAPMEFIDDIATQILVRGKYLDNIERGMSHQEAINNADDYTAGAVADRSKGSMPTIFNAKNPLTKLFTLFQLEVNNQYSFLFKDLPREAKELGGKWLAMTLLKAAVGSYIYNELYEKLTGRRPAVDPIGTTIKALKQGTPLDAIQSVAEDALENTPFIGGLLGGGRLPTQAALPEFGKMWDTAKNIQDEGFTAENVKDMASAALKNPLTYLVSPIGGGGQAKKTIEGLKAFGEGASMTDTGRMRFPIKQTPGTGIKMGIFGQYAAPEAREYFEKDRRPLSENQTQQVLQSRDPQEQYRIFVLQREANKIQQQIKDIAGNQNLTITEKDKQIKELQQKFNELWATQ